MSHTADSHLSQNVQRMSQTSARRCIPRLLLSTGICFWRLLMSAAVCLMYSGHEEEEQELSGFSHRTWIVMTNRDEPQRSSTTSPCRGAHRAELSPSSAATSSSLMLSVWMCLILILLSDFVSLVTANDTARPAVTRLPGTFTYCHLCILCVNLKCRNRLRTCKPVQASWISVWVRGGSRG